MADFKEGTLIVYSLLGLSPKLRKSIGICFFSIILTTIIAYAISLNTSLIVLSCGTASFFSLFVLTKYLTPIFIPEKNTRNCAAIASLTTILIQILLLLTLFTNPRVSLFGLPLVFLISYLYIAVFSRAKTIAKFIVCFTQTCLVFIIFFRFNPGFLFSIIYMLNTLVIAAGIISVEKTLDAPMYQVINVSWMDGGRILLSSLMNGNFSIEDKNPDLGEHSNLPIKLLKISDNMIIFPALHPGPFGELGASRMPSYLNENLNELTFTPHTPTTHDFNPIRKKELEKITDAIKNASFTERKTCSKLIKKTDKEHNINVYLHVFGKKKPIAVLFLELQGRYCDISYELWEVTRQIAKNNIGYEDVFMVDAHNYYTDDENSARIGTYIGEITKNLIRDALKEGINASQHKIEFASVKKTVELNEDNGFGKDGIGAFAFSCDGETTVYLYLDGNSLLPELSKTLTVLLNKKVDNGIVLTTDTHAVHTMGGGHNPIGENVDAEKLVKIVEEVLKDLSFKETTVEVADTSANIWIWSPDLGTRYIQAVYTTIVSAKWYLPTIMLFSLFCTLLITLLA